MMDIHLSPRQVGIIRFALGYAQANLDDINEMIEESGDSVCFEGTLTDGEIHQLKNSFPTESPDS